MNLTLPNPARPLQLPPAKVGGIFDTIEKFLNLGLQGYGAYQAVTGAGAGSGSGQARGLPAITAKSNEVLALLDQMVAAAQQNPTQAGALLQQAEQVAATLGSATYFYQAKSGQDAKVLSDAKTAASQKVAAIRALATGAPAGTPPVNGQLVTTNQNGQLVTVPAQNSPVIMQGESNQMLLYAALGLGLLAILKK